MLAFAKWPLTVAASVVVLGVSSEGTLSLFSDHAASVARITKENSVPAVVRSVPQVKAIVQIASVEAAESQPTTPLAAVQAEAPMMRATLSLAVRSQPKKTSELVATLEQGELVRVKSKNGNWLLVTTEEGKSGWAFGRYLVISPADRYRP
ncbi:MAG: SH3 domain-containing protein [Devosia sp.]